MTACIQDTGRFCIVVSGLPGSGKSTVGKLSSDLLDIPVLDKDTYLEALGRDKTSAAGED